MAGCKTCPTQEDALIEEGLLQVQDHPWKGNAGPELRPNAPLSLYLNKLLAPRPRLQEAVLQPPVPASPDGAAEPAQAESTWQRAKSSAAKTLRAATPRRQKKQPKPSRIATANTASASRAKPPIRSSRERVGDAKQKIMMGLIPVLAVTMVFLLKNPLKPSPVAQMQNTPPSVAASAVDANVEIDWEIPAPYQPGGRDPMRLPVPPVTEAVEELAPSPTQTHVELAVTGILYSQDKPAAIVDTRLVHEGQQVSGATVKKIESDGVEFEMNGRTWKQVVDRQ